MKKKFHIFTVLLLVVLLTTYGVIPASATVSEPSVTESAAAEEQVQHTWMHTVDKYGVPIAICWECKATETVGGTWEPLTSLPVLESTNAPGGTDVVIGTWKDIFGIPYEKSIRFWVNNSPDLSNTESITFDLAGEYKSLAFVFSHEEHSTTNFTAESEFPGALLKIHVIYKSGKILQSYVRLHEAYNEVLDVTGVESLKIEVSTESEADVYGLVSAAVSKDSPEKALPVYQLSSNVPEVTETAAEGLTESSRLAAMQSSSGVTTVIDYDENDRIEKVTVFNGHEQIIAFFNDKGQQTLLYSLVGNNPPSTIEYLYNSQGKRIGAIYSLADGHSRRYNKWNYNGQGQLTSWFGSFRGIPFIDDSTYYTSTTFGEIYMEQWANYEYNNRNQLVQVEYYSAPGAELYFFTDFTYNNNGQLIRTHTKDHIGFIDLDGQLKYNIKNFSTDDYYYDDAGRVERDSYMNYFAGGPLTRFYSYDSGNVAFRNDYSSSGSTTYVSLLHDITGEPLFSYRLPDDREVIEENGFVTKIISEDETLIFQYE